MDQKGNYVDVINDLFRFALYERRGAYKVWATFGVNRFELWMLLALVGLLCILNKKSTGRDELFRTISGTRIKRYKFQGYFQGLINKGLVRPVELVNGRESWIISRLGIKVIEVYQDEILRLEKAEQKRARKRKPTLPDVQYNFRDKAPERLDELNWFYKSIPGIGNDQ